MWDPRVPKAQRWDVSCAGRETKAGMRWPTQETETFAGATSSSSSAKAACITLLATDGRYGLCARTWEQKEVSVEGAVFEFAALNGDKETKRHEMMGTDCNSSQTFAG
jgi:hypothetical protein